MHPNGAGTDNEQGALALDLQENEGVLCMQSYYRGTDCIHLASGRILSAASYAKLQNEINFVQEHNVRADATVGGTQELSNDSVLDEVAEGPLPQDDTTTAEVESHESEAEPDSAIHRYLKTV